MRIPLSTDLISREGATSKDAKLLNCFIEPDGQSAMVIKRPAVNSALVDVTGTAQGGIASNSLVFIVNGDVLRSYNSSYVLQDTEVL